MARSPTPVRVVLRRTRRTPRRTARDAPAWTGAAAHRGPTSPASATSEAAASERPSAAEGHGSRVAGGARGRPLPRPPGTLRGHRPRIVRRAGLHRGTIPRRGRRHAWARRTGDRRASRRAAPPAPLPPRARAPLENTERSPRRPPRSPPAGTEQWRGPPAAPPRPLTSLPAGPRASAKNSSVKSAATPAIQGRQLRVVQNADASKESASSALRPGCFSAAPSDAELPRPTMCAADVPAAIPKAPPTCVDGQADAGRGRARNGEERADARSPVRRRRSRRSSRTGRHPRSVVRGGSERGVTCRERVPSRTTWSARRARGWPYWSTAPRTAARWAGPTGRSPRWCRCPP